MTGFSFPCRSQVRNRCPIAVGRGAGGRRASGSSAKHALSRCFTLFFLSSFVAQLHPTCPHSNLTSHQPRHSDVTGMQHEVTSLSHEARKSLLRTGNEDVITLATSTRALPRWCRDKQQAAKKTALHQLHCIYICITQSAGCARSRCEKRADDN